MAIGPNYNRVVKPKGHARLHKQWVLNQNIAHELRPLSQLVENTEMVTLPVQTMGPELKHYT